MGRLASQNHGDEYSTVVCCVHCYIFFLRGRLKVWVSLGWAHNVGAQRSFQGEPSRSVWITKPQNGHVEHHPQKPCFERF